MRHAMLVAVAGAALAALAVTPQTAYEGVVLTVLYSGDTYGQLESCG